MSHDAGAYVQEHRLGHTPGSHLVGAYEPVPAKSLNSSRVHKEQVCLESGGSLTKIRYGPLLRDQECGHDLNLGELLNRFERLEEALGVLRFEISEFGGPRRVRIQPQYREPVSISQGDVGTEDSFKILIR